MIRHKSWGRKTLMVEDKMETCELRLFNLMLFHGDRQKFILLERYGMH